MRKKLDNMKLLAVFSMATLIFLLGIIFGNFMSERKVGELQKLEQDLRTDTIAAEVQYLILADNPCTDIDTTLLTEELYQISSKIAYMENQLGGTNPEVVRLKEYYSLLQIRHWMLLKKIQSQCDQEYNLILYFYSNRGDCPRCEQQGFILNYIRKKFENARVYAFDINNQNAALNTLKNIYRVSETPSIIVNDRPFSGFMTTEEIEKELR
jgi:hypothetical protein